MTCANADKDYPYTFFSTKNYDGTAVEELVEYVKENDTLKIVQFLSDHKDVDRMKRRRRDILLTRPLQEI